MYYFSIPTNNSIKFESAGIFINNQTWRHSKRTITSFEFIFVINGILPIEVDGVQYTVHPNEILIIPPNVPHFGFKDLKQELKFIWIHFNCPNFETFSESDLVTQQISQSVLLPNHSNKLDIQRVILMSHHLLDIVQEQAHQHYLDSYLNSIIYEISHQTKRVIKQHKLNHPNMQPIQEWIRIHALENIDLDLIANRFNYNKSYLSRKYKKVMGIGINQQIAKFRIMHAEFLLNDTNLSIQEIANSVGYVDDKYFMRIFKKFTTSTPSQYRRTFNQRHFNKK